MASPPVSRRWENEIKVLITFAFITDATLKIYGWALFLDKNGLANYLLAELGFPPEMVAFLFTDWATLLGMVYSLWPSPSSRSICRSAISTARSYSPPMTPAPANSAPIGK